MSFLMLGTGVEDFLRQIEYCIQPILYAQCYLKPHFWTAEETLYSNNIQIGSNPWEYQYTQSEYERKVSGKNKGFQ